ncbi:arginine decarboxylase, pyruvoyl-dependent [candidate division WOR-3 bacterium JGI_Cruoil_03_51_56]|uniref:Pyruvoyl-dependent arginine decarboxylase AaxB n=1 Tax=candidate division WOR-3 bacterium JGI_Cruoil_03_51_56 TaxID=1973747 RepID=A0A235BSW1_UNCW3|nr:MAG: arginine decarboxylase, pyruvoyl-dependent [candidate division WOR-3 bacterium JGI_Cruoil_03_51_56]
MTKMTILPEYIFLTKGVGHHREKLASFEAALRNAGIAAFNLVRVSSILPPHCKKITRKRGLEMLTPGQVVFVVMSDNATNEPHRLISASIGVAIPKDSSHYGYLSEYHSFGEREKKAGDYAEDLAAQMLATTLGVRFDPDASYDERKEIWRISGGIVCTQNITQSAIGDKRGRWTSVVAAAVLIPDK